MTTPIYPEAQAPGEDSKAVRYPWTAPRRSGRGSFLNSRSPRAQYLTQQSMDRYQARTGHAPELLQGHLGQMNGMRIVQKGRTPGKSTHIGVDFGAPGGDMSAVWAFAAGVPVLMHPSWIDDQMEVLKPYQLAALERFGVRHRAVYEREAEALAACPPIQIPAWPTPDLSSEEQAVRRAASWQAMREWIDGQRSVSFALPPSLMRSDVGSTAAGIKAMQDAIQTGTGVIRTTIDPNGDPRSEVVPVECLFRDDVQNETESAPGNAGTDQHQNEE